MAHWTRTTPVYRTCDSRLALALHGDRINELSIKLRHIREQTFLSIMLLDVMKAPPAKIAPQIFIFD